MLTLAENVSKSKNKPKKMTYQIAITLDDALEEEEEESFDSFLAILLKKERILRVYIPIFVKIFVRDWTTPKNFAEIIESRGKSIYFLLIKQVKN